jgi:ribose transport system substrate-binding protein
MISVDSFEQGYLLGKALFDAIGGEGKIFAIEGLQSTSVAVERYNGLLKALEEYPDIELAEHQPADWDRTVAFPMVQTWLTKHPDVKGIWAANDDMALGALEALREKDLAGEVLVAGIDGIPEAIQAVKDGEFVMTIASDATYQGSIGFALGYCFLTGQVPMPSEWDKEERMYFLTLAKITADNADIYLSDPDAANYADTWTCDGLWSRSTGPSFPEGAE